LRAPRVTGPRSWQISTRLPVIRSRYGGWLRAGWPRDRSSGPGRDKIFLFTTVSTQPPIQWVPRGVKRPVREADHSTRTSAEVKNTGVHTSTPLYAFMA
jgi:hypothetical protein